MFDNFNRSDTNHDYYVCVEGIPKTGAKSRVEIQTKLTISLASKRNKPVNWSFIHVPEDLLVDSKMKRSQRQKLKQNTLVPDESKLLYLNARIICESDPTKIIQMCQGCVRRERKRSERKKHKKYSIQELNNTALDESFERDRKRILLFNCDPLLTFSDGKVTLPTRITCYCRHHDEPIGFRVRFLIKDYKNDIIATGESPSILVTDDHKVSPQPILNKRHKTSTRRKRYLQRTSPCKFELITPAASRKNSICEEIPPLKSISHTPTKEIYINFKDDEKINALSSPPKTPTPISSMDEFSNMIMNPCTSYFFNPIALDNDANGHKLGKTHYKHTPTLFLSQNQSLSRTLDSVYSSSLFFNTTAIPILDQIVPENGPTTGGIQITVSGKNFYPGLTLMFGNRPAIQISYSSTSMVYLLPVAENQNDTVTLSFKEQSFMRSNPLPPLFHYFESTLQDMMKLVFEILKVNCYMNRLMSELDILNLLLSSMTQMDLAYTNTVGQNLLHFAAKLNFIKLSEFLISRNPGLVYSQDLNGLSPLHFACKSKSTYVIDLLVKAGAQVYLVSNIGSPLSLVSGLLLPKEFQSFQNQLSKGIYYNISWVPSSFVAACARNSQENCHHAPSWFETPKYDSNALLYHL